jgi:hypothetical protein
MGLSIISSPAGMMPAAMTGGHRVAGFAHVVVEAGHDAARQLRLGHQLDGDLGDDRQHALAADHQRQQVVARRVQRVAAEGDRLALDVKPRTAARCAASGRTSGSARRRSSRPRCRRWCRRSGWTGRARSTGRGRGRLADGQVAHAALHDRRAAASGSSLRMRLKRASDSVTPSACGMAPPDRPVPAPRATTGTLQPWQALQHGGDLPRSRAAPPPAAAGGRRSGRRIRRAWCLRGATALHGSRSFLGLSSVSRPWESR